MIHISYENCFTVAIWVYSLLLRIVYLITIMTTSSLAKPEVKSHLWTTVVECVIHVHPTGTSAKLIAANCNPISIIYLFPCPFICVPVVNRLHVIYWRKRYLVLDERTLMFIYPYNLILTCTKHTLWHCLSYLALIIYTIIYCLQSIINIHWVSVVGHNMTHIIQHIMEENACWNHEDYFIMAYLL